MTVTDEAIRAAGFDFARAGRSAEFRARLRRLGYDGERDSVLPVMASELFSDAGVDRDPRARSMISNAGSSWVGGYAVRESTAAG